MTTRLRPVRVFAVALVLLGACKGGASESERGVVRRWLSCETCQNGERAAVAAVGPVAITLLVEPLDTTSRSGQVFLRTVEADLLNSYALLPNPPTDADTYVRAFLGNALALAQARSAASLGDLGAVTEITAALAERSDRGLRPEVVAALESALVRATTGRAPDVDSVVVFPPTLELEVGRTVSLSTILLDVAGTPVEGQTVTWSLAGPSAASLDAASGLFTAAAPGVDTVLATHPGTGVVGRAVLTTVEPTPLPFLTVVSGDHQSDTVGARLPQRLVVRARNRNGTPAAGVPVAWRIASGGGALADVDYSTDANGLARAVWWLGDEVGSQLVQVTGPTNLPVLLRATAFEAAGTSGIRGVVLGDGVGLAGVTAALSTGATTTTDAAGAFSFYGVAPGAYDVTVTGFPPGYSLVDPTRPVTITPATTRAFLRYEAVRTLGTVAGALFIDDSPRNNVFDGTEAQVLIAGVTIRVIPPSGDTLFTVTDADGHFAFASLPAGTYAVSIDPGDPGLPANVSFGGASPSLVVAVPPGGTAFAYFPFDPR